MMCLKRNIAELFGVVYAEIETPLDLPVPILLTKIGNKTVAGLGSWSGWYFTEELKFAIEQGYKVKVLKGYIFERANIFSGYIDTMYNMRLQYPKGSAMNMIAKLLLNSLAGRFGINLNQETNRVISLSAVKDSDLLDDSTVVTDLNNGFGIIASENLRNVDLANSYAPLNVSLPVAMAITAYGRIYINRVKLAYKDNLYYSDTDSIVLDCQLDPSLISDTDLGLFKLEKYIEEGIFLGPKFYGLRIGGNRLTHFTEITKIKGYKGIASFSDLKSLLNEGAILNLKHEKWFRNIDHGVITAKEIAYKAAVNNNKRELVYENGKLVGTKPLVINAQLYRKEN